MLKRPREPSYRYSRLRIVVLGMHACHGHRLHTLVLVDRSSRATVCARFPNAISAQFGICVPQVRTLADPAAGFRGGGTGAGSKPRVPPKQTQRI